MLPNSTLPASLRALLTVFEPCFTTPTFRTFCALVAGSLSQTGPRTVCGMLVGAGLSREWAHDRAHRFFSHARWSPDRLGVTLAVLVVSLLVPAGAPVTVVVDDTLFRRRGRKVWAASWFHDGSAQGPKKVGFGNNWGKRRHHRHAADAVPPGVPARARFPGDQEHYLVLAAVAGPAHGRRPRPRAT